MTDAPFEYTAITSLYNSSGVLQNKGSYTPYRRDIILRLRDDIDTLGEILGEAAANWTNNNYDWLVGDRYSLDTDKRLWLSYITDMRTACENLSTTAGISAPTWTIASLVGLYKRGKTATISGTTLTQTGADFADVTNNDDYCYIQAGTGATIGRYQITGSTTDTLTLSGYSGDSGTGDVAYDVLLTGNKATYTQSNLKSLITDIRVAILDIMDDAGTFTYFVDSVGGSDAGAGTRGDPYETYDKAVTETNSVAGNIYLFAGSYTKSVAITQAGITVQGESVDSVTLTLTSFNIASPANNHTFKDIKFVSTWQFFSSGSGFLFERCIFGARTASTVDVGCHVQSAQGDFKHCSLFGDDTSGLDGDWGIRVGAGFVGTINVDDCYFITLEEGIKSAAGSGGTINIDYCTFEDVATKTIGGTTFNNTNEFTTATTNIGDFTTMYLYDDSDMIGEAGDGFDIGAYPQSPYNVLRTVTESIAVSEASEMSLLEPVSETIKVNEDLATVNMNVSVDMPLWGIFESAATDGAMTYLTNALITSNPRNGKMVNFLTNFSYNGSALDLSWDNADGDSHEVHIAVSDLSTDYTSIAWWESNALTPAATTSDTNGTRGYAIDCYLDTELDEEWGDQGTFSTAGSSDGVNDQQWDITLKIRIKNTVTGTWSELVTLAKTYNFNTFADTMYYCGDNPRMVDNEYADHANYSLNGYHTTDGADKLQYTRPDGVNWIDDNRRFAYTPSFKAVYLVLLVIGSGAGVKNAYQVWQNRTYSTVLGTIDEKRARATMGLYPAVFANFGDYNYNSDHCFATTNNFVFDDSTYNTNIPVMGLAANQIKYLYMQGILLSDCIVHSSFQGFFYMMPSGELISHSVNGVGDGLNPNSDLIFLTTAPSPCSSGYFMLEYNLASIGASAPPTPWSITLGEMAVNVDNVVAQNATLGQLTWWAEHIQESTSITHLGSKP